MEQKKLGRPCFFALFDSVPAPYPSASSHRSNLCLLHRKKKDLESAKVERGEHRKVTIVVVSAKRGLGEGVPGGKGGGGVEHDMQICESSQESQVTW